MGLSSDELGNRSCGFKFLHFPAGWSFAPFSSFIWSRLKYWRHIQVLATTPRLITLNNWALRRSMRDLSSRCWPTKDHPMLMSAPGSYYCPLKTRAYLQHHLKSYQVGINKHPKSKKFYGICFSESAQEDCERNCKNLRQRRVNHNKLASSKLKSWQACKQTNKLTRW